MANIGENYLNSEDLEKRYEELLDEEQAFKDKLEDLQFTIGDSNSDPDDVELARVARDSLVEEMSEWDDEYGDELVTLKRVCEKGRDYVDDWTHGVGLYHEDIFDEHAEELAKDCSDVPRNQWDQCPFNCIDWSEAAELLKQDYTTIEIEGHTYYAR
jgi:hypothetical protein